LAEELLQVGYHAVGTSSVSKVNVPIIDTPTTVNVVTSKLIEDRKPNDLVDALSSVSGVSQANTLGGIFDAVQKLFMSGYGQTCFDVLQQHGLFEALFPDAEKTIHYPHAAYAQYAQHNTRNIKHRAHVEEHADVKKQRIFSNGFIGHGETLSLCFYRKIGGGL